MNSAVVTGASSGIGLEISRRLVGMGYRVFGVARNFDRCDFSDSNFIQRKCDLTDHGLLLDLAAGLKKENVSVLVNCAGVGYFAPHEEIRADDILRMVNLNLSAPLLLTREFLRTLKENGGSIININSMCALRPSPRGCVYAATKAGLRHFGLSLFEEARKSGLKVVNINPDMTQTPFFDHLHFQCVEDPMGYLEPSCVANAVEHFLTSRAETVISEITLQPQKLMVDKKDKSR